MVPQFETCGTEITLNLFKIFSLALTFSYFLRVVFVVWRSLNSLPGLFTVPLRRMTDLASEQTVLCFTSVRQSMLFF